MWKLSLLKKKYIIKKFIYSFLKLKIIRILLRVFFYLFEYLLIIRYTAIHDFSRLQEKKDQWKEIYFSFNFFKHILFIFFIITGIIPVLFFFYLLFFSTKYLFKYLFLTLDYFFSFQNKTYLGFQGQLNYIYFIIPNILLRIYRYFFGGGWIRFFWTKFKNYWKNKWLNFLHSFFSITDDLILVKSPNLYAKLKEKILDLYYWSIKIFFLSQRKIKDILKFFRNILFKKFRKKISKKFRKVRKKYRLVQRFYDKFYRKYYYFWYFWYIKAYVYYAWIFRKYIWSDIFVVTIEAFSFIAFWNFVACVKYSLALFYTRLQYIYCQIFFNFWVKIIFMEFPLANFFQYLNYEWRGLKVDIKYYFLEFFHKFCFNMSVIAGQIIYASPYLWYWWRHDCYEVDKGFISLMWYSLKFYAIIQKFFRRLYPLPWRLFFFNAKIRHLGAYITYQSVWRVVARRFIESCYYMFYLKFIYFI